MPDNDTMQRREPAKAVQRPATGTDTIAVLCNLPSGIILQIYDVEEVVSFLPNGREIRENMSTVNLDYGQYALNGVAEFSTLAIAGRDVPDYRVIRGATPGTGWALTTGIPRDFWERWLKDNARNPVVTGEHVKAANTESRAVSLAKDLKDSKSGFQPLNQSGDYRVPNGVRRFDRNDMQTSNSPQEAEE